MGHSHSSKTQQLSASRRSGTGQGRLSSLALKNGNLHILNTHNDLPQALIAANDALKGGLAREAANLLNSKTVEVVHDMLEQDPSRTDLMFVLAVLFRQTKQISRAKEWLEKILQQEAHALVYNELAGIYQYMGQLTEAIKYQRKAIETDPDKPELRANLGRMLIEIGQTEDGIELLRKAIEKMPEDASLHSNLLFYLHYLPTLDAQALFDEHQRWACIHAPESLAGTSHKNVCDPDRRLRIGYISPDFCNHPVAHFFEPLLDGHDHQVVEVYGYSDVRIPDKTTERLKPKFDYYRNIRGLEDRAVAGMIEQDQIDILVELAGHTTDNRLLVLARKPAPIQVTYLGAPDTTGLSAIDYRFTDSCADTPKSQPFYTEELIFLPKGFLCYRPPDFAPPVAPFPALGNGYITFGSFNNNSKIHPPIIALWAQILKANENSRLLLKFGIAADNQVGDYYFSQFEQLGISRDRVAVCGFKSTIEHWKLYSQVDIALDTYPFNGYTTACETLWMGVPIISMVGRCHASRAGLSILNSLGLALFAAKTPDEYLARATVLAQNLQALSKIRASMRERITTSTLGDAKGFARRVEQAYRKMWYRWVESKK